MTGDNFRDKKQETRNKSGFTLMEILVVLAIFSLLSIVIINVYLLTLKSQQQASLRQKTLANLRYVMETIAKQVRTSEINYLAYPDETIISPVDELYLINELGQEIEYSLLTGQIKFVVSKKGAVEEAFLTDLREVWVTKFNFYISPITDPFSEEERCDEDSDCEDTSSGCSVFRVCVGGSKAGQPCSKNEDCLPPDGSCPAIPVTGFCICSEDSECQTLYCDLDEGLCLPFNQQPRVTIVLGFQSQGVRPEDQKTIYLQTTISSRVYRR